MHMFIGGLVGFCLVLFGVWMATDANSKPVNPNPTNQRLLRGVYEVRLTDGTRCVRLYESGIDCDWRGPKGEMYE